MNAQWSTTAYRVHAPGAWPGERVGRLVRFEMNGITGHGEASPMPGYSLDTVEEVDRALTRATSSSELERLAQVGDIEAIALASERIAASSPAAACALETALLDWMARTRSEPVAALLADGRALREVAVNRVVTPTQLDLDSLVANAADAWESGYRAFKLKVARRGAAAAERAAARALRTALPAEMELRLDANGGWEPSAAPNELRAYADCAPRFCEQPTPVGTLPALPRLTIPFAADESCRNAAEVHALLTPTRHPSLAAIVLKPMALGGALRCLALAQAADRADVPVVVTHLLDGPLSAALSAELAAAAPGEVLACGLAQHPNLDAWRVTVPQLRGPTARSAGVPGLGIRVDEVPR